MILGLDLSSSCTGFGVIGIKENHEERPHPYVVEFGQFKPSPKLSHGAKYGYICQQIRNVLKQYESIDTIVLEMYFVGGFKSQGTFICSELRGSLKAMLSMEFPNIKLAEDIFPSSLKKFITGSGKAEKIEVARKILDILHIEHTDLKGKGSKCSFKIGEDKYADDVSDALSLAYYHYRRLYNE